AKAPLELLALDRPLTLTFANLWRSMRTHARLLSESAVAALTKRLAPRLFRSGAGGGVTPRASRTVATLAGGPPSPGHHVRQSRKLLARARQTCELRNRR